MTCGQADDISGTPADQPSDAPSGPPADAASLKASLRRELLAARAELTAEELADSAAALARTALTLPELTGARTVAAYVSVGREPGTRALLDALRARRVRVLLPVLQSDHDLDWAVYEGTGRLLKAGRGLLEPAGPRLGAPAVLDAGAVLLPGLAADTRGMRLGRGGGSYDRVLARLAAAGAHPALVVLLYGNEVVARVPSEPHDHPVDAVVTPAGTHRFGR
ncbi:5-formyltetrahydrofolate cyclo-ligase [Streptomyces sp. NPDC008125]|uniref:5-formyltetrahydrofolate cyclo-ligase n=1 Tax=Streptomyces sp. NPDC008125 TaxID=3364811 RepID=UPI0036E0A67C